MRTYLMIALLAASALAAGSEPAAAFGDRCYGLTQAKGQNSTTMQGARASAIAAWERSAARAYGNRYADWYYSGDRAFDCTWNADGGRIRCVAEATPCGRK
jgi:hypothetical protein